MVVVVVDVMVGVVLVATGLRPADNLHYLYGASLIVTVPLVGSYIADKKFSRPLAYGLAGLFMAGLAIRASTAVETVSLPEEWRDRARIVWGAPGTPAAAVRFAPCPPPSGSPIAWNGYAGGFMLRTKSACVPLIFAVGDRRATIRFGVGRHC